MHVSATFATAVRDEWYIEVLVLALFSASRKNQGLNIQVLLWAGLLKAVQPRRRHQSIAIIRMLNSSAVSELMTAASLCDEFRLIFRRCHVVLRAEMTTGGKCWKQFRLPPWLPGGELGGLGSMQGRRGLIRTRFIGSASRFSLLPSHGYGNKTRLFHLCLWSDFWARSFRITCCA